MEYATELGVGLSSFVSVGNKADISGNDLVAYWDQDPRPMSCSCTSSPSGTRDGSHAWRATSAAASRSSS